MSEFHLLQREFEVKSKNLIRRVRTPAGARRFGQPIGSIIVPDVVPSLDGLHVSRASNSPLIAPRSVVDPSTSMSVQTHEEVPTDYPGTRKWKVTGHRGRFYSWQDAESGRWVLADHQDKLVHESDSEEGVEEFMRSKLAKVRKPASRSTASSSEPRRRRVSLPRRLATAEEVQTLREVHKIRVPPAYVDSATIVDDDDWLNKNPVVKWTDKRGKDQPKYTSAHDEASSRAKFERVARLAKVIDNLDAHLEKVWREDDSAAALLLMRRTGIRPSSRNNETGDGATYGVTTLQARHVTINKGSVRLKFIGKKLVEQDHTYKDAQLIEMFTLYGEGKKNRNEIFPGATEHTLRKIMKEVLGDEFKVYDLRTLLATQYALQLVDAKKGKLPKNKTEMRKWRNEVGDAVSDVLGNNRTEALKSYIDPEVFRTWEEEVNDD